MRTRRRLTSRRSSSRTTTPATITFKINIPNSVHSSPNIGVAILDIDSDANQATGDPDNFGADFVLQY